MATMTSCVIDDRALSTGHHFGREIFYENDDLCPLRARETPKETSCVKDDRDLWMNRGCGNSRPGFDRGIYFAYVF